MKILINGCGVQRKSWRVWQNSPTGYCRVYYILSGEVCYDDGRIQKRLRHGCLYVFPASVPYRIEHDPMHPIECLWLHIDFFPYDMDRLLELDPRQNPTLHHIMEALLQEGQAQGERAPLFLSLAQALCHTVLRQCAVRKTDGKALEILEYMRGNFAEQELTVGRLAEQFGYSTEHLIRLFGAKLGTTPHRYLRSLRLARAAELLLEGASVSRASNECGFGDSKTFSRAFRAVYGVAPSEYARFFMPQA